VRLFVGTVLGAIGAMVTHHLTQSVELAVLVGCGIALVIWFAWIDLGWELICKAAAYLARGEL